MITPALTNRSTIIVVLILQVIPLLLFPIQSYSTTTQEWWLPAVLALLVVIADIQIIVRHRVEAWPWYLMSFAQGFNIISRLLMLWPNSTHNVAGVATANIPYIVLTLLAMALSVFMLWYVEQPDVRNTLLPG